MKPRLAGESSLAARIGQRGIMCRRRYRPVSPDNSTNPY